MRRHTGSSQSFHLAMFSISMSRAKRLEKCFHSRSAHDFPLNVKILAEAAPGGRPAGRPSPFVFSLARGRPSHGYCHGEKCEESPSDAPHLSLLSPEMNLWSQCASMFNKNTSLSVLGCVNISQMSDRIPLLRLQKRFLSISNDIRLIGSNVYASLYN